MEKALLLERLNGLVTRYRQHRSYIEKAQAQKATGKFKVDVIERVILDHEIKASDVADEVGPLLPALQTLIDALVGEKASVHAGNAGVDEQVQELELRAAIGELSDEQFESESADLRARLDTATSRVSAIDVELEELQGAFDGWASLATPHGHYAAAPAPEVPQPSSGRASGGGEASAEQMSEPEPEPDPSGDDVHVRKGISEDVGDAYSLGSGSASVAVAEEIAIETSEGNDNDDDGLSEEVSFGADETIGGTEVELDLGGDGPVSGPSAPVQVAAPVKELTKAQLKAAAKEAAKETPKDDDAPRRALLLYQEGTAEEQIYPFTNDALTIGRGRENDIQIKNDSKVSRYHCKLQRRGNNFYIEDAKSSNGTLVNGELITDRRLFGGEEIIIGETFFRFRIME